jgi:SAM-dependent methyltransferase
MRFTAKRRLAEDFIELILKNKYSIDLLNRIIYSNCTMFYVVSGVLIILLLILLSWMWPPDSPWAPGWKIQKDIAIKVCKLLKISKKDIVYELGCGDGEFVLTAAKYFGAKAIGIEIDPLRFLISKIRVLFHGVSGLVTIYRKNFFDVELSSATIVFLYLVPRALERVRPKLEKELQVGTKIISYRYEFPKVSKKSNLVLDFQNKELEIFVYKVTK